MSFSKKKTVIWTAVGILAVSLFAAALFLVIPSSSRIGPIVFAMSTVKSSAQKSTIYFLGFDIVVSFVNGSSWESTSSVAELNSTDIASFQFWLTEDYFGGVGVSGPFSATFQFAHSFQIFTGVTGETALDLGMLSIINNTISGYSSDEEGGWTWPANLTVPPALNYTMQRSYTGDWSMNTQNWNGTGSPPPGWGTPVWTLGSDQIQSILANATDTVNIAFSLDETSMVNYVVVTPSSTQTGTASLQYSGPWGALQLFPEEGQLSGFQWNFSDIGLTMTAS